MKKYKVRVSLEAKEDLREILRYLKYELKNGQAAQSVMADYIKTRNRLALSAGSLQAPEPDTICGMRNLKRINFSSHEFFLLFRLEDDIVYITNIFHQSQDYEKKL